MQAGGVCTQPCVPAPHSTAPCRASTRACRFLTPCSCSCPAAMRLSSSTSSAPSGACGSVNAPGQRHAAQTRSQQRPACAWLAWRACVCACMQLPLPMAEWSAQGVWRACRDLSAPHTCRMPRSSRPVAACCSGYHCSRLSAGSVSGSGATCGSRQPSAAATPCTKRLALLAPPAAPAAGAGQRLMLRGSSPTAPPSSRPTTCAAKHHMHACTHRLQLAAAACTSMLYLKIMHAATT
jgi:hypothetical protein